MSDRLAVKPFVQISNWQVFDARGFTVLTCSDDDEPCELYSAEFIDMHPHFMCPKCGRLGIRMDEATPKQCGLIK